VEHVVFWPRADGSQGAARVASLDEAMRTVECLHNDEDVVGATVHELTEVPLAFRTLHTYHRVEVSVPEPAPDPAADPALPRVSIASPVAQRGLGLFARGRAGPPSLAR